MSLYLFHNHTAELNELWYESHAHILKLVCMELDATDRIEELRAKYLGDKLKIKAPKDPNKPKRGKTGFMYFCDEYRPGLMDAERKQNKKINLGEIAKALGASWKKLSKKKLEKYVKLAEKDKERYEKEISEYNEKNGLNL